MLRSWVSRIATAAAPALIVIAIGGAPALAQSSAYSRMGLYTDEARSSSVVSYAGSFTEATMYVYFAPSSQGLYGAEFSLVYPANVLPADVTTNPLISVYLGDLSTGVSCAFLDCQTDWVWSHHQRLFLTSADPTFVTIAASSLSGEYQAASCEPGYPLEPVFFSSLLGVNAACEPDTTHPLLESAGNATPYSVAIHFSEPVLKIPALIPANYEIASAGDSSVTVPVSSTEFLSDGRSVMLYVSEPLSAIGSEFVVHASGVYDSWGNEVPSWSSVAFNLYDLVPPQLVSASATIDSVLTVVFNEPMSPATATNPDNYRIYNYWGAPVASYAYRARLTNDRTVALSFDNANLLPTFITLTLKVANVTDLSGHVISPLHNTAIFSVYDRRPPFLVTAQALGKRLIDAGFNEVLERVSAETAGNYKVYQKSDSLMADPLPVAIAYMLSDGKHVRLAVGDDPVFETSYVLRVLGIKDIYDNRITVPDTIEFRWSDVFPPLPVAVTPLSSTLLNIVFDEPLDETTAEIASNYEVYLMYDPSITIPVSGAELQAGGATVQISLGASLEAGVSYTISISNVMDVLGNAITETTISTTFADIVPPLFTGVTPTSASSLDLAFSEAMSEAPAENTANYVLFETGDSSNVLSISSATRTGDGSHVQLALASSLENETSYTVSVSNLTDLRGVVIAAGSSLAFAFIDTFPPELTSVTQTSMSSIELAFSEAMSEDPAEDASNYLLFETGDSSGVLSVSSATLSEDGAHVQLALAANLVAGRSYTISASNLRDLNNNPIVDGSSLVFAGADLVPPMLTSVAALTPQSIELAFDEAMSEIPAKTKSNYMLFETAQPSNVLPIVSATLTADGSHVRLALAESLVAGMSYTISVSNCTDLANNAIAPGSFLVFTCPDIVPPTLLSAYSATGAAVLAAFSEKLDTTTAQSAGNYAVYQTANASITVPVSGAALAEDSSKVLLTLGSSLVIGTDYSLGVAGVNDRASNPIAAGSVVPIARPDLIPPELSAVDAMTLQYVKVAFNEAVTAATAGATTNYLIIPASDPGAAIVPSSITIVSGTTAGLHFSANLEQGSLYRVRVSNVLDLAGNAIAPGSEMSFTTPTLPASQGKIGLYVDDSRTSNEVRGAAWTSFSTYVWYLPGDADMMAAEFSIAFPSNVIFAGYSLNPIIPLSLGEPLTDLSVAFSDCQRDWVWILRGECLLTNSNQSIIEVGPAPILANCNVGFPIEPVTVVSRIYCNFVYTGTLLADFAASFRSGTVEVTWRLSQMDDGVRFSVLRKEEGAADFTAPAQNIEASGLSFIYRDESAEPGSSYRYRVQYANASGSRVLFETEAVAVPALPLTLNQNWPNPFNPTTTISYYLPEAGHTRLDIYDIAGHRIACLVNGNEVRGDHSALWDGTGESGRPAAAGVYIYRLTTGRETLSRKMVLVR